MISHKDRNLNSFYTQKKKKTINVNNKAKNSSIKKERTDCPPEVELAVLPHKLPRSFCLLIKQQNNQNFICFFGKLSTET